jgi:hypothetical protein
VFNSGELNVRLLAENVGLVEVRLRVLRFYHVRLVTPHPGVALLQVADGGDALQMWRIAANILSKQPTRSGPPA